MEKKEITIVLYFTPDIPVAEMEYDSKTETFTKVTIYKAKIAKDVGVTPSMVGTKSFLDKISKLLDKKITMEDLIEDVKKYGFFSPYKTSFRIGVK